MRNQINGYGLKPFTPKKLHRRVYSQLWMLALQFVLGMILNLVGGDTHGASHTSYDTTLIIHILNAIGLVEGGIYIALKERSNLSWWGAAVVSVTFCGGILTKLTGQDAWSFIMACGFLATSWIYIVMYMHADRVLHTSTVGSK